MFFKLVYILFLFVSYEIKVILLRRDLNQNKSTNCKITTKFTERNTKKNTMAFLLWFYRITPLEFIHSCVE